MHKLLFILYFQLFSARELNDHVSRIKDLCENSNADWEKRCDSVRALLITPLTFHVSGTYSNGKVFTVLY